MVTLQKPVAQQKTHFKHKRLLLVSLLIVMVAISFWSGSRYPALNEKAMMGGETDLAALGFDTLVAVTPADNLPWRIIGTTINWIYTNQQGMTFGLLFGALLLTWLPLIGRVSTQNRWVNTFMGMAIGTPMGVCVNCAAPIAQGIYAGGAKVETTLATMISSPTLNVIVVSMLYSLLPPYLATLKLALTLAFILVGIPVLTRVLPKPVVLLPDFKAKLPDFKAKEKSNHPFANVLRDNNQCEITPNTESWGKAGRWVLTNVGLNLWRIIKLSVPFMLLSGLLGSIAVTLLPFDALSEVLPVKAGITMLGLMGGVGLMGLFLPVPMSFDVIITTVLLQAGLPMQYAAVLLFTLGIFSVYSFLTVWRSISKPIAVAMALALVVLGVWAGDASAKLQTRHQTRQMDLIKETLLASVSQMERGPQPQPRLSQGSPDQALVQELQQKSLKAEPVAITTADNLSVERLPFVAPVGDSEGKTLFTRLDSREVGFNETDNFSLLKYIDPLMYVRGIAAGDVHNDGYSDIVVTADAGLALYANQQGQGYEQQQLDIPNLDTYEVINAALVDLNNDSWLDLYFSTHHQGNFLVYNTNGRFTAENVHPVPNHEDAVLTMAPAFGDTDQDGDLDIVLGNWAIGTFGRVGKVRSIDAARNVWLRNQGDSFEVLPLQGVKGETLSTLLTDMDGDDRLDLIIGNDFSPPDTFYLGKEGGSFKEIYAEDGFIPHTTRETMSFASADLNNDLVPEIYAGQIAQGEVAHIYPEKELCAEIENGTDRENCTARMQLQDTLIQSVNTSNVFRCQALPTEEARQSCIAVTTLQVVGRSVEKRPELCEQYPDGWETFVSYCQQSLATRDELEFVPRGAQVKRGLTNSSVPQIRDDNVLLVRDESGNYIDQADQYGLTIGGWTWNAKFADVDNDEWQDLYMVNGPMVTRRPRQSNYFYRNQAGETFADETDKAGLTSLLDTFSSVYTDMDNDGDLDIISVPNFGPIWVYVNNSTDNQSVEFELRDQVGNPFGIGSKVIVHYGDNEQRHQMREIQASGGYLSFDAPIAHFGLGDYNTVDRVEVVWSTGERSEVSGEFLAGGRYVISRNR